MNRLVFFELAKVWQKRNFLFLMAVLVFSNLFLIWYASLSDGTEPGLSAYKALQRDMQDMTEGQKKQYIGKRYRDIEGIRVVQEIMQFQAMQSEMGRELARQEMEQHPGVWEQYREAYVNGSYLKYTESFEQEHSLIAEVYGEAEKVYSYPDYLAQIRENRDALQGISIFAGKAGREDFASRNVEKSAEDYEGMDTVEICYVPSKGITSALESDVSDVLLLLSVLLFAGGAVHEERQKRLFLLTRATVSGRGRSIAARLGALGIHCMVATILIYVLNLVFFAGTAGIGSLFRSLQSVAPYRESSLSVNVLSFVWILLLTKAGVMYLVGVLVMLAAVLSRHPLIPYLAAAGYLALNLLLYFAVPAWSSYNWLKYLSLEGMLKTADLYGSYLNLNFSGYPLSRLVVIPVLLAMRILAGIFALTAVYLRAGKWEMAKTRHTFAVRFRPHGSLFCHEGYKILVMNRVFFVLLLFGVLIGYRCIRKQYSLPVTESYYQDLMLQLQGENTPEKETLVNNERARYDKLFAGLRNIDGMTDRGELTEEEAESMKAPLYSELAFYPSFQRVLQQYDRVKEGGWYVYDTGYLYLFGIWGDEDARMDLLLLTLCVILAFHNVMAMEEEKKMWQMLSASESGRREVVKKKLQVSILCAGLTALIPVVCRCVRIHDRYPLCGWSAPVDVVPAYYGSGITIPLAIWAAAAWLLQISTVIALTLIVCFLSDRLKNHRQALFTAVLILLLPLILKQMGFPAARWVSLYPLYAMPETVLHDHGAAVFAGYASGAVAVTVILMRKMKHA